MTFEMLREKFKDIYEAVKEWHNTAPCQHRGHGFDHDVTVAMLAVQIAPNDHVAEMAFVAGLLHSTDRTMEQGNTFKVTEKVLNFLSHLPRNCFTTAETVDILISVIRHSEMNQDDQSLVQQVLQDADRLANLQMTVVMRAAQHQAHMPVIELEYLETVNPNSTYHVPMSALDDLKLCIRDYIPQLRLPKAIALGERYKLRLEAYISEIIIDYEELGLKGVVL